MNQNELSCPQVFETELSSEALKETFKNRISHSKTVGKDGVTAYAFEQNLDIEVERIARNAHNQEYRFTTYKQKLILKGANKPPREISIATVRDRLTLRAITNTLTRIFKDEAKLIPAHYIIKDVAEIIQNLDDSHVFIQIDIRNFYPTVLHEELLKRLRRKIRHKPLLSLILAAVRTPTSETKQGIPNNKGIPQGLSISNVLSSIYMQQLDKQATERFVYFRFVDDILVVCSKVKAKRNFAFLQRSLSKLGLDCHPLEDDSKTKIVPLSKGVEYLGYHLTPKQISVRKSSYRKIITTIMKVMTNAKYSANNSKILTRLNIKITGCVFEGKRMGWMFYFSQTTDLKQLQRLDSFVTRAWKKQGMEQYGSPKRFIKAFHEIRYNLASTKYIPRFDEYTLEQKKELIVKMGHKDASNIELWSLERVDKEFLKIIRKEVAELEQDMTPTS